MKKIFIISFLGICFVCCCLGGFLVAKADYSATEKAKASNLTSRAPGMAMKADQKALWQELKAIENQIRELKASQQEIPQSLTERLSDLRQTLLPMESPTVGEELLSRQPYDCEEYPPPGKIPAGWEWEPNDTCTIANYAFCEHAYCGEIIPSGDQDWWEIWVPAHPDPDSGYCVQIWVYANATQGTYAYLGGLDPRVWLYQADCVTQIAFNDDYNGIGFPYPEGYDSGIDCNEPGNCLEEGLYYIKIDGYGGTSQGPYLLVINCIPCAFIEVEECEFIATVNPDVNNPAFSWLWYADDTKWFCWDGHPDLPPYPYGVAWRASFINVVVVPDSCYIVFISNSVDENGNPIPGISGYPYAWVNINNWHPNSTRGITFNRHDSTYWMGDWNTNTIYHVAIDPVAETSTLLGSWPASYFDLDEMPIAGLELDPEGWRLWAITNDSPDEWLLFDVSVPANPSLLFGPSPVAWQTGTAPNAGAGLEYNVVTHTLLAINQQTNCAEAFADVGNVAPVPMQSCSLYRNVFSWGIGAMDGPGTIDENGYRYGITETIDIVNYAAGGPFPFNWYVTPVPFPSCKCVWHLDLWWKNCPYGRPPEKRLWDGSWLPLRACAYLKSCQVIRLYQAHAWLKRLFNCHQEINLHATDWDWHYYHIRCWMSAPSITGQGIYFDLYDTGGFADAIEYGFPQEDHNGMRGMYAQAAPSANTDTATFTRYSMVNGDDYTIVQNHPYSAVHVNAANTVGPGVVTMVQPGEGYYYDAGGVPTPTYLTVFTNRYCRAHWASGRQTATVDFVLHNPFFIDATVELSVSDIFTPEHNAWFSYPGIVMLLPFETQIVPVEVEIPSDSTGYSAIVSLHMTATNTTMGGISVMAAAALHLVTVVISVSGEDLVLNWAEDLDGTGYTYNIYKSETWPGTPVLLATTTDTTYTDVGGAVNYTGFYYLTVEDNHPPSTSPGPSGSFFLGNQKSTLDKETKDRMREDIRSNLSNESPESITNPPRKK